MNKKITIGLFGTCGNSTWRNRFMEAYDQRGIQYFNPLKEDWKPEDAILESEHLIHDEIILSPITNETYAYGSLAESGFFVLQAIKLNERRDIVIMIDPDVNVVDESFMSTIEGVTAEAQRKDSIKMRHLVNVHLKKISYPNIYVVDSLDKMLKLSLELHALQVLKEGLKRYTI